MDDLNTGQLAMKIYGMEANGEDWKNSPEYAEFRRRCPGYKEWGE